MSSEILIWLLTGIFSIPFNEELFEEVTPYLYTLSHQPTLEQVEVWQIGFRMLDGNLI